MKYTEYYNVSGDELINKVKDYFKVLTKESIIESEIEDEFYDIFKM
ncbi:MAG: hypothetical protein U9N86_01730 [Bacteroidota bacterium]|nr:hypothetical protein [Bacteroidota bacterium]